MLLNIENRRIIYTIDNKEYIPKVPKRWYGRERAKPTMSARNSRRRNPINGKKEECSVFECENYVVLDFPKHVVYFLPIIDILHSNFCFISKTKVISLHGMLAIRNWQIHARCFDYSECPFLEELVRDYNI